MSCVSEPREWPLSSAGPDHEARRDQAALPTTWACIQRRCGTWVRQAEIGGGLRRPARTPVTRSGWLAGFRDWAVSATARSNRSAEN